MTELKCIFKRNYLKTGFGFEILFRIPGICKSSLIFEVVSFSSLFESLYPKHANVFYCSSMVLSITASAGEN